MNIPRSLQLAKWHRRFAFRVLVQLSNRVAAYHFAFKSHMQRETIILRHNVHKSSSRTTDVLANTVEGLVTHQLRHIVPRAGSLQHYPRLVGNREGIKLLLYGVHVVGSKATSEDMIPLVDGVARIKYGGHDIDVRIGTLQAVHVPFPVVSAHRSKHGLGDGVRTPTIRPEANAENETHSVRKKIT